MDRSSYRYEPRPDRNGELRDALLTLARQKPRWGYRRLWAVLEPRSNSMRRRVFQDALPAALALGDCVVLGSVHRAGLWSEEQRLDPESVASAVRALGKQAGVLPSAEAIADLLAGEAKSGDLILIMSNGSFDGLCEKLVKKLAGKGIPSEVPAQ